MSVTILVNSTHCPFFLIANFEPVFILACYSSSLQAKMENQFLIQNFQPKFSTETSVKVRTEKLKCSPSITIYKVKGDYLKIRVQLFLNYH